MNGTDALAARIARADTHLARFRGEPLGHFIGGRPVAGSGETFENRSPVDASLLGLVRSATRDESSSIRPSMPQSSSGGR